MGRLHNICLIHFNYSECFYYYVLQIKSTFQTASISARAISSTKRIITSTPVTNLQTLILVAVSLKTSGALELELIILHSNISIELFCYMRRHSSA